MTSYFPDVNVWVALCDEPHVHSGSAWRWLNSIADDSRILFARYTHLGLLRMLTNAHVMGSNAVSLGGAWKIYDRWLEDPRVASYPEPDKVDNALRRLTLGRGRSLSTNAVGDCYILAFALNAGATLVTFDRALFKLARQSGCKAVLPGGLH